MTHKEATRKPPSALAAFLGILLITLLIALAFVVTPLLALLVGMTVGYILELVTGDYVIQALQAVGLNGVQDGDLPKVFGLLALVAMFFRSTITQNKRKKGDD